MKVDLWFPVVGRTLPSDHGYALYGALCRVIPELHEQDDWGLHTFRGEGLGAGIIGLSSRPQLGIRVAAEKIPNVLSLAGQTLDVQGHVVRLGGPTVAALAPTPSLSARLVTIKNFMEPGAFAAAVLQQIVEIDSSSQSARVTVGARKVIRIAGRTVVGFSVRVVDLSEQASTLLQEHGVGGRRKMGCGIFRKSDRDLAVDRRPEKDAVA
jgi:CRISPR-associated protein Cas6